MAQLLPLLVANITRVDPRFGIDQAYAGGLAIQLRGWQSDRDVLLRYAPNKDLATALDSWKKKGFYVGVSQGTLITPSKAVDTKLAHAAYRFARQSINTLNFVLKDGNLERYIEEAKSMRAAITESDHQKLEQAGRQLAKTLFGENETSSGEQVTLN